ncbi:MAG: hypothetical protein PUC40_07495 [Lachnospiraceae bacterium]|nr:hypothetical protein [Lachnospiraceae bacterium]MDD6380897.1 hypothetical protein [Lachnospiraceae bacterium]
MKRERTERKSRGTFEEKTRESKKTEQGSRLFPATNKERTKSERTAKEQRKDAERMRETKKKTPPIEYIICGKAYHPESDILLCESFSNDFFKESCQKVRLYATAKGAFYRVSETLIAGTTETTGDAPQVEVIGKETALKYMDGHAADIINANYKKVFGEPEQG